MGKITAAKATSAKSAVKIQLELKPYETGASDDLMIDAIELRIFRCAAQQDAQIGDLVQ